nr:MAG TPA: hypothetical protein [Caudoviricetes sp.]
MSLYLRQNPYVSFKTSRFTTFLKLFHFITIYIVNN